MTAQLEDARRQLGQAAYGTSSRLSPQSNKDYGQVSAENAYLRDENADLRRQIYSYRVNYGHLPPPPPGVEQGKEGGWGEVKQEGQFAVGYGQGSLDSPQRGGSVHRNGPPRQSGEIIPVRHNLLFRLWSLPSFIVLADFLRNRKLQSTLSTPMLANRVLHLPAHHPTRPKSIISLPSIPVTPVAESCHRHPYALSPPYKLYSYLLMLTASSKAPGASPYVPPNPFPDQRYAQGPPGSGPGAVRYESMYPAPPPHSLPRVGPGMYDMSHPHPYASRPDGGEGMWAPEVSPSGAECRYETEKKLIWNMSGGQTGPPPFQSQNPVSYQMGFAHDGQQHHGGGEEWRQDH